MPLREPSSVIDSDDEYVLYGVVAFKKVHDEFVQKCRERKFVFALELILSNFKLALLRFIVRDYQYSEDQIAKQQQELATADITEKELWVSGVSFNPAVTDLDILTAGLDRVAAPFQDQFLRVFSNSGSSESHQTICRKRTTVWSSRKLHWTRHKGQIMHFIND